MALSADFLDCLERMGARLAPAPVRRLYVPALSAQPDKNAEFGILELADGSTGLVYLLLEELRERVTRELDGTALQGRDPLELARRLGAADPLQRALAFGALNALSQQLFARAGYAPDEACDPLEQLRPQAARRFGMVGLFPPLVERLRAQGVALTVLELRAELAVEEAGYEVTLDPRRLRGCDRVLCTATTLLNDSLTAVLAQCRDAECIALVGPTAGFVPDPVFAAGVDLVAGTRVPDAEALIGRCRADLPWGPAAHKYCIHRATYPGLDALLRALG